MMQDGLIAQWHTQEFVQLVFPHKNTDWNEYFDDAINSFVNIAKTIQKYQKVLIVAQELIYVKSLFKNKTNITFVKIDSNDTWSRDFGGISVKYNNAIVVLDFKFNGWGKKYLYQKDDAITRTLKLKGLLSQYKHKTINMVLEGGSIDSNGDGTILTTTQCLLEKNRNPHLNKHTIEKNLKAYLQIKKVLWLDYGALAGDDTNSHIDTLARFTDTNTIVYQTCEDKDDENYNQLYKMKEQLKTLKNHKEQSFNLIALPSISKIYYQNERLPATYVNFLIINGAVLVPIYRDKNDKKALNIFKQLFKNRDIVPIDCTTLIRQHGSLHCITMQYFKNI
jgi:agmatine deiminase